MLGRTHALTTITRTRASNRQGTHYRMEKYGKKKDDWSMSGYVLDKERRTRHTHHTTVIALTHTFQNSILPSGTSSTTSAPP